MYVVTQPSQYGYVCNKETEDEIFFENIFQNQPELAIDSLKCSARHCCIDPPNLKIAENGANKNDPIRPSSSHENENKKGRPVGLAEC